jgi:hypothetical protein
VVAVEEVGPADAARYGADRALLVGYQPTGSGFAPVIWVYTTSEVDRTMWTIQRWDGPPPASMVSLLAR